MKDWLRRLQHADETTKRRWLVALSLVAMGIVLFVWLRYFGALVNMAGDTARVAQEGGSQSVSFGATMRAGAGVIFDRIKGTVSWLGETLQAPRDYIIKP